MSRRFVPATLAISALLFAAGCGNGTGDGGQAGEVTTTTVDAEEHAGDDAGASGDTHLDDEAHEDEAHEDETSATPPREHDGNVVEVEMVEFGFEGGPFEVAAGEPVTFRFTNTGAVEHEAMFGDAHQQDEFAASNEDHGDHGSGEEGGGHHGDVQAITLGPGESAELTVTLEHGDQLMGCHLPGHYDAGMVSPVSVI